MKRQSPQSRLAPSGYTKVFCCLALTITHCSQFSHALYTQSVTNKEGLLYLGEGVTEKQHSLAEGSPPGTGELQ